MEAGTHCVVGGELKTVAVTSNYGEVSPAIWGEIERGKRGKMERSAMRRG